MRRLPASRPDSDLSDLLRRPLCEPFNSQRLSMHSENLRKPRFEDNGDIEPCDTESMRIDMLNSPDDSGVSEASSRCLTEDQAAMAPPRGEDAAISVPLLQSPTSVCSPVQGQGDAKANPMMLNSASVNLRRRRAFATNLSGSPAGPMGPRQDDANVTAGNAAAAATFSQISQELPAADATAAAADIKAEMKNQEFTSADDSFPVKEDLKSAVSRCQDDDGGQSMMKNARSDGPNAGQPGGTTSSSSSKFSSSSVVSVIDSSADDYSKITTTTDDSCNEKNATSTSATTMMTIKPSDDLCDMNNDDFDLLSKTFFFRAQSPSSSTDDDAALKATTESPRQCQLANAASEEAEAADSPSVAKDQSPTYNAISTDRSSNDGGTNSDAGAVSQVATNNNDIPNSDDEPQSFKDAQDDNDGDSSDAAKKLSLSSYFGAHSCGHQYSPRSGWGIPLGLGLKGGAGGETTVANGTSGWGPPPSGASNTSGWGAPPPPNPAASAAWGAPNPAQGNKAAPNDEISSFNAPGTVGAKPQSIIPAAVVAPAPVQPAAVPTGLVQPPQTSTSWAAAAGKGLPVTTNEPAHTTSTISAAATAASNGSTSKHLEQLNSVREALFSQDGWGGSNVKQDSAWDVGGPTPAAGGASGGASGSGSSGSEKESNMWSSGGGNRNDGTDLWKSTLYGQPPAAAKPQTNSAWNPQNNTDFKQWGVDEEDGQAGQGGGSNSTGPGSAGGSSNGAPRNDSMWGNTEPTNGPSTHFGNNDNKPRGGGAPDWGHSSSSRSWADQPRDQMMGGNGAGRGSMEPMSHREVGGGNGGGNGGGWGPAPQRPSQWNSMGGGNNSGANSGGSRNANTWDESPSMSRKIDDGTGHWNKPTNSAPGPADLPLGVSNWKTMPSNNSQMRGPPGPPGPRLDGPVKDNGGIWGPRGNSGWDNPDSNQMGGGGGGGGGYNNSGNSGGWPDIDKRDGPSGIWDNSNSGWNKPRNPVGPNNMMPRSAPGGWGPNDDSSPLESGAPWPSNMKAVGPKKPSGSDMTNVLMQNKTFRMLIEMGYRREDAEKAMMASNGTLEDATDILSNAGIRMPQSRNMDPMYGGHGDSLYGDSPRRFPGASIPPYPQDSGLVGNPGGFPGNLNSPNNPMLQKIPSLSGGINPNSGGAMPPGSLAVPPISRQQPNSQPSAHQLRMLVQQIQMAVQAGHLNPQILNQPLAPQTLILLNQLLQQIKALQGLQKSHNIAQAQRGMSNSGDVLSISVNITKTKQHITNLQNQISAQQAAYLKSSQSMPSSGLSGSMPPSHMGSEPSVPDLFNELTLSGNSCGSLSDSSGGSRLLQWKNTDNLFGGNKNVAPGGGVNNKSSPGLGFGADDTWGLSSNSTSSGWPDSKSGPSRDNAELNGIDSFGIPEFEPGKPWKGPGLKNPDDDPTLTPGSVAGSTIDLMGGKGSHSTSSAANSGSNLVDNSLSLTSPTWSYQAASNDSKPKDSWGGSSAGSSSLTAMGQDLWGKSGRTPPGLGGLGSSGGWPSTTTSSSNGWSTGQNGASSGSSSNPADQPAWLLLKNLTPQIDGSTLKTLCMQHGPLKNFHLFLNNGIALVMYATGREANKAQKALNNCLLGNTTIQANMTSEVEANSIMQQLGAGGAGQVSRGNTPSSSGLQMPKSTSSSNDMWVPTSIFSGGGSSVWGAPSGTGNDDAQRNTPLQSYLPGDLLGESNM